MLLAITTIVVACALSLVPYLVARRILVSKTDDRSNDLAGSVLFRIGALHSLILALVFAQELVNFNDARKTMTHEAALLGNVFYDLQRYDEVATLAPRQDLADYANLVLNREWDQLAQDGTLNEEAWEKWKSAYIAILDLAPLSARQQSLKDIMLEQIREISELRINRENAALSGVNRMFLFAAVLGVVLMSFAYFPFPPSPVNLTLLLTFGIYTGFVMFFILAFSNPYSGAGYVEPVRFERLYDGMLKSLE